MPDLSDAYDNKKPSSHVREISDGGDGRMQSPMKIIKCERYNLTPKFTFFELFRKLNLQNLVKLMEATHLRTFLREGVDELSGNGKNRKIFPR